MTLTQELIVTAEMCGTNLSELAAQAMVEHLARIDRGLITAALKRCQIDGGRLTLHAVMSKIEDGRPTATEAFARLPWDESDSAVLPEEAMLAMGDAAALWRSGDKAGARIAFTEAYNRRVAANRTAGFAPVWFASEGQQVRPDYRGMTVEEKRSARDAAYLTAQTKNEQVTETARLLNAGQSVVPEYKTVEQLRAEADGPRISIPPGVRKLIEGVKEIPA